jgi:RCC1 and BTB domain-containing protein
MNFFSFLYRGNGDHGKLGHGSSRKVAAPNMLEKLKDYRVVRVASYNEHTAALVEPCDHGMGLAGSSNHAVPVTAVYTSQILSMVNDEEFSDLTFMIENEPIYAHRAIISKRSDTFAAMFRSGMRESTERVITLPNISKSTFLLLLEYLYTDTVKIRVEDAIELYICADQYQLERLRDMCCDVVRRNLSAENSGPLLQTASEAHCSVLRELCMTYVVDNFDTVSKTEGIKQMSHSLLLEVLSQR